MNNSGAQNLCFVCRALSLLVMIATTPVVVAQSIFPLVRNSELYREVPVKNLSKDSLEKVLEFSYEFPEDIAGYVALLNFDSGHSGQWRKISQHYNAWVLRLSIRGAAGMAAVISHVKLSRGAKLYVYNEVETRGPYGHNDIPLSGTLVVDYLKGDDIVIELDVPVSEKSSSLQLRSVSFADSHFLIARSYPAARAVKYESCYPCLTGLAWENVQRSAVKLITFRESVAVMCTGVLMNNTSQDGKPYILTAQHCITNQADADNSIFIFGDVDINCHGRIGSQRSAFSGSVLRASSYENDFSLVELNNGVPLGSRPYFAGWDITDSNIDDLSCVHHPLGDTKKISLAHDRPIVSDFVSEGRPSRAFGAFWHVPLWDAGFTEGGSSGAPLFNGDQKVIGTLTGGKSTCDNPHNDYFERLSASWSNSNEMSGQLERWLDPLSSKKKMLNGFDPFGNPAISCDTVSNIRFGETTGLVAYPFGQGLLGGCNSDSVEKYAEKFEVKDGRLTGLQIYVGSIDTDAPGGVTFSVALDDHGTPGKEIASIYVSYSELHLYFNYIDFYPYVAVNGKFFVTYRPDCSERNPFAIELAQWRNGFNSSYLLNDGIWQSMQELNAHAMGTSLYIEPIVCTPTANIPDVDDEMALYPNPASSELFVKLPDDCGEIVGVQLQRMNGQTEPVDYHIYFNSIFMDVSLLSSAPYALSVTTKTGIYVRRFFKM